MKKMIGGIAAISAAILLAGCMSSGTGGGGIGTGGGGSGTGGEGSGTGGEGSGTGGEGSGTGGEGSGTQGYSPTFYQSGQTLAQVQANGVAGPAVTPSGLTQGTITTTADGITVTAGNRSYTLPFFDQMDVDETGTSIVVYVDNPNDLRQVGTLLNGQYVGLADIGERPDNRVNAITVAGQETANIPLQRADYEGVWLSSVLPVGHHGTFAAQANFGANSIDYQMESGATTGSGSGTINGSQFAGDITLGGVATGSGTVVGSFYGPAANEIAGISSGTYGGERYMGAFYGAR